jgi:hypothetical protein
LAFNSFFFFFCALPMSSTAKRESMCHHQSSRPIVRCERRQAVTRC